MDEDGKSFVPRVFGFKNERAVLRTWGRAATMSFLMTQKKKIKSNPGSLYLPSSDGVGTRCALLARLVFDRVSRVGLFLFVCVCARARAREGGWGK